MHPADSTAFKNTADAGGAEAISALLCSLSQLRGFVTERERAAFGTPKFPAASPTLSLDKPGDEAIGGQDREKDEQDLRQLCQLRIQVACLNLASLTDREVEEMASGASLDAGDMRAARDLACSISAGDNVSVRSDSAQLLFTELTTPTQGVETSETDLLSRLQHAGRWPGDPCVPVVRQYMEALATTTHRHRGLAQWVTKGIFGHRPESLFELVSLRGLTAALERFDPFRGNRLSTYATHWIRQSVQRAYADYGFDIRMPVHLFDTCLKIRRMILSAILSKREIPKVSELVEQGRAIRVDVSKIAKIGFVAPVDLWRTQRDDGSLESDALFEACRLTRHDANVREAVARLISAAVRAMPVSRPRDARARAVIERRFRLCGRARKETLESIAQSYGITRERVRQVEAKALKSLAKATRHKLVEIVQGLDHLRVPTTTPLR